MYNVASILKEVVNPDSRFQRFCRIATQDRWLEEEQSRKTTSEIGMRVTNMMLCCFICHSFDISPYLPVHCVIITNTDDPFERL